MARTNLHDREQRARARRELARSEPVIGRLVRAYGDLWPKRPRSMLQGLAVLVIDQQISVHAARAIRERVNHVVGGRWTLETFAAASDDALCGAGLSRPKLRTLRAIFAAMESGAIAPRRLAQLDDASAMEELQRVHGIGPWTAEMTLFFILGRPDILATGDLGLQNAMRNLFGLRKRPSPKRMHELARPWRPYRSLASVYLWASLEKGNWVARDEAT